MLVWIALKFLLLIFVRLINCQKDWYKYTTIYQIYPQTFKDSNGDGVGDLNGITSQLDYLVELGVETIWLNPFYESPFADNGYDISNFTSINPIYGTMEDFDKMVSGMKKRGLKFMMDFVANHCSDEHIWFKKSIQGIKPYKDYFVWKDAKGFEEDGTPIPPNNWLSIFNGPGWTWNEQRKQFFYHQFSLDQPDFDLRNPELIEELKQILRFWIDKGTDAIRLDATKHFFEDKHLRNEDYWIPEWEGSDNYWYMRHSLTVDLWETYELIHELREFVDKEYNSGNEDHTKVLISEAYTDTNHTMMYFGRPDYPIVHFPFNFVLVEMDTKPTAAHLDSRIHDWIDYVPEGGIHNWVSENHDNKRIATKFGPEFVDLFALVLTMLPGVACIYYGQEIAMENVNIRADQHKDRQNAGDGLGTKRDGQRTPMQWDDTFNAGFTTHHKPWLPVNPNYWEINVETERRNPRSHFHVMQRLLKIKKTPTAKYGDLQTFVHSPYVFVFTRTLEGYETYIVVVNLGQKTEIIDLRTTLPHIPNYVKVMATSINALQDIGEKLETKADPRKLFALRPKSGVLLTTNLTIFDLE